MYQTFPAFLHPWSLLVFICNDNNTQKWKSSEKQGRPRLGGHRSHKLTFYQPYNTGDQSLAYNLVKHTYR